MPQLQTHMLRVGAIGKIISDGWKEEIDNDLVIRTLLLHDMGNITKFDLSDEGQRRFKSTESENLEYWRSIQKRSWLKYGMNTHLATKKIVVELKQDDVNYVMDQDHNAYHSANRRTILTQSWPARILQYTDTRVTPSGVVSLEERIADLCKRYNQTIKSFEYMYTLENEISKMTTIDLDSISERDAEPLFDNLLSYNIKI